MGPPGFLLEKKGLVLGVVFSGPKNQPFSRFQASVKPAKRRTSRRRSRECRGGGERYLDVPGSGCKWLGLVGYNPKKKLHLEVGSINQIYIHHFFQKISWDILVVTNYVKLVSKLGGFHLV